MLQESELKAAETAAADAAEADAALNGDDIFGMAAASGADGQDGRGAEEEEDWDGEYQEVSSHVAQPAPGAGQGPSHACLATGGSAVRHQSVRLLTPVARNQDGPSGGSGSRDALTGEETTFLNGDDDYAEEDEFAAEAERLSAE